MLPPQRPPGHEPMGHAAAAEAAALPIASDQLAVQHGKLTLPDGVEIAVPPCFAAAECLFRPEQFVVRPCLHMSLPSNALHHTTCTALYAQEVQGSTDLVQALSDCGMSVDPAIRELLFDNTVLFGGGADIAGLKSRLVQEADEVAAIMVSNHMQCSNCTPILHSRYCTGASNDLYQQLCAGACLRALDGRQHPGLPALLSGNGCHTGRVGGAWREHPAAQVPLKVSCFAVGCARYHALYWCCTFTGVATHQRRAAVAACRHS